MSTVQCKNCGAAFDSRLSCCPYCGSMNKRGAYAAFRAKISSLIDAMLGLKENVEKSVSRIVLSSFLRALIIIAVIIGLAFAFSRTAQVNYYNDPKYDQQAYEEIVWMDENLDRLNAAYDSGDYKTVEKLYYEKPNAVRSWSHYPAYSLKYELAKLEGEQRFTVYSFQRMLYFLFYPEYFAGYNGMNKVDGGEYEAMRQAVAAMLENRGYPLSELQAIYEKCADPYGYVDPEQLKGFMKEGGNG